MTTIDPLTILQYPLSTEKSVRKMEAENTLIFIVAREATKSQIKWATQKAFNVKVDRVRTLIQRDGKKKAYIKLKAESPAVEVTTQLGLA